MSAPRFAIFRLWAASFVAVVACSSFGASGKVAGLEQVLWWRARDGAQQLVDFLEATLGLLERAEGVVDLPAPVMLYNTREVVRVSVCVDLLFRFGSC